MATSRQSARNCGPRRWASAWCTCSRKLTPTNPRDLGCRMALKFIHRLNASRCNDFLRLPGWLAGEPRHARPAQRCFGFLERSQRLARRFKAAILLGTFLVVVVTLASSSSGRYLVGWLATRSRWAVLQGIGIPPGRDEIDADWRRRRLHDIEQTRGKLRSTYAEYDPAMRRLLDYAGLDPDHALLRWGNFDRTLYLPSTIFEPDDTGRSYPMFGVGEISARSPHARIRLIFRGFSRSSARFSGIA